ncbi:MAG: deoxyguanosinetriphosphate triphosphohydrolase [Clostridia bacterium]|nr:deoxyguanosinetriphosphate triphosphohydrolase [Clostridia bacterium]
MAQSVRSRIEQMEGLMIGQKGVKSVESQGRQTLEPDDSLRTCFQRDKDRILHCNAFRRLKYKTQVFLSPERDHYRTRLTHTLEVSQIARTIARSLQLNEDLTEAIALGHDLGHTPFGHAGERALDACFPGGFRHNEHSVRVVQVLEKDGKGLNLTHEVLDGIVNHTSGVALTWEGRVVRLSDRIAYINHDIDDAIRAGVLKEEDIPASLRKVLGDRRSQRINTLVNSVVDNSLDDVMMDPKVAEAFEELHNFMFCEVYRNPVAKGQEGKAITMVQQLYRYFTEHTAQLPGEYQRVLEKEGVRRAACDYIAGMTDRYAVDMYTELFVPYSWK